MSDASRRTARTVLQNVLALAAGLPLIIDAADLPAATPGVAVSLAVAGAITRIMALPVVDRLLPPWLRAVPPEAR
jgi:ABC-type phosphate transport system permease subunit